MALRLGKFFGNGPEFWIGLQTDHDLWTARQRIGDEIARIKQMWNPDNIPVED
jgi:antitoxin HigA-1